MSSQPSAIEAELFSTENLTAFASAWFRALDVHAPTEECIKLLVPDGLQMIFPEKTLHGLSDFTAWYAGGTYGDGEKAPGVINIFFDEVHTLLEVDARSSGDEAVVDVVVGWQASWFRPPAARSSRTSMNASQQWILAPAPSGRNPFGIVITSYNAVSAPFEYAPGFARL